MTKKKIIILTLAISFCFPAFVFAETIVLKSGKSVEGKLIEKTDKYIKIDFMGVPLTYFFDEIESIDGKFVDSRSNSSFLSDKSEKSAKDIFKLCSPAVVYVETDKGFGSGFIIDKSGIVVTNYHVVNSAENIIIRLKDGREYEPVSCLNYNILEDLCILKINSEGDLDFIALGDEEKEEIGEKVFAIGNPQGLQYSISDGIISQKEGESLYRKMIQFTCPISSGSSGGPLLDPEGKAIGVVTQILMSYDGSSISQNLNFAISISNVKALLNSKEEITLAELLDRTKENAAFYQALSFPDSPDKYEFIIKLDLLSANFKDSFMMRLELLRILNGSCLSAYMVAFKDAFIDRKKEFAMQDRKKFLEWSLDGIAILEKSGGVEGMLKNYKLYFNPTEYAEKMTLENTIMGPYFSAAIASIALGDEDGFRIYSNKLKEFIPNSSWVSLLEDIRRHMGK